MFAIPLTLLSVNNIIKHQDVTLHCIVALIHLPWWFPRLGLYPNTSDSAASTAINCFTSGFKLGFEGKQGPREVYLISATNEPVTVNLSKVKSFFRCEQKYGPLTIVWNWAGHKATAGIINYDIHGLLGRCFIHSFASFCLVCCAFVLFLIYCRSHQNLERRGLLVS